uniref:Ribulose bisphosphate carboxylase/oxygenase activase, chloroplastic (Fragments) n=1 Tax=Vitis sp. TaxID=3604 RepID=RCA_VITSX|nr:RecName: Full=Ribulose bisphosphate carboxylase/oxygenase activase, chloroplastic; Short=RA; Short=RuBisCO activase [Vitis sp.]
GLAYDISDDQQDITRMGINPIMMSAGELESGNAGEPAKMCCLFINDLDAGAGRIGVCTGIFR